MTKKRVQTKPNECAMLIHRVPKELRHRFRLACVSKDVPMQTQIAHMMDRFAQDAGF